MNNGFEFRFSAGFLAALELSKLSECSLSHSSCQDEQERLHLETASRVTESLREGREGSGKACAPLFCATGVPRS